MRYLSATNWGTREYMNMDFLREPDEEHEYAAAKTWNLRPLPNRQCERILTLPLVDSDEIS